MAVSQSTLTNVTAGSSDSPHFSAQEFFGAVFAVGGWLWNVANQHLKKPLHPFMKHRKLKHCPKEGSSAWHQLDAIHEWVHRVKTTACAVPSFPNLSSGHKILKYHSIESWVGYRDSPFLDYYDHQYLASIIPELIINQQGFWTLFTWQQQKQNPL